MLIAVHLCMRVLSLGAPNLVVVSLPTQELEVVDAAATTAVPTFAEGGTKTVPLRLNIDSAVS
jgi:hypothetical protein